MAQPTAQHAWAWHEWVQHLCRAEPKQKKMGTACHDTSHMVGMARQEPEPAWAFL